MAPDETLRNIDRRVSLAFCCLFIAICYPKVTFLIYAGNPVCTEGTDHTSIPMRSAVPRSPPLLCRLRARRQSPPFARLPRLVPCRRAGRSRAGKAGPTPALHDRTVTSFVHRGEPTSPVHFVEQSVGQIRNGKSASISRTRRRGLPCSVTNLASRRRKLTFAPLSAIACEPVQCHSRDVSDRLTSRTSASQFEKALSKLALSQSLSIRAR